MNTTTVATIAPVTSGTSGRTSIALVLSVIVALVCAIVFAVLSTDSPAHAVSERSADSAAPSAGSVLVAGGTFAGGVGNN